MRSNIFLAVIIFLPLSTWAQKKPLKNKLDSVSYAVGINLARSLKQSGLTDLNKDAFYLAITHVLEGGEKLMDMPAAGKVVNDYLSNKQSGAASKNLAESEKWLGAS